MATKEELFAAVRLIKEHCDSMGERSCRDCPLTLAICIFFSLASQTNGQTQRKEAARMAELERCPVCGKAATVIHMVDTYDRADYGWDAGCAAAKARDGIHNDLDLVRVVGMPSENVAVKVWNNKAQKVRAQKELAKAWRDCLRGEVQDEN